MLNLLHSAQPRQTGRSSSGIRAHTSVVTGLSPGLLSSFGDTAGDTKENTGTRAVGFILLDPLLALIYRLEFHLKISFQV